MRKRLRTTWGIVSNIETARSLLQWLWPNILTGVPSLVGIIFAYFKHEAWFAVVIGILAMTATILVAYFVTRSPKKKQQGQKGLVFPYIRTVNASALVLSGEEYLSLLVCFPSQLDRVRLTLEGEIIIDGHTSNPLPAKDITLYSEGVNTISDWRVPLTKAMVKLIQERVNAHLPVTVVARIWDRNNKDKYRWETERWTTLLLTKLN